MYSLHFLVAAPGCATTAFTEKYFHKKAVSGEGQNVFKYSGHIIHPPIRKEMNLFDCETTQCIHNNILFNTKAVFLINIVPNSFRYTLCTLKECGKSLFHVDI